jgi:hypothetical protein
LIGVPVEQRSAYFRRLICYARGTAMRVQEASYFQTSADTRQRANSYTRGAAHR